MKKVLLKSAKHLFPVCFMVAVVFSASAQTLSARSTPVYRNTAGVGLHYLGIRSAAVGRASFLLIAPFYDRTLPWLNEQLSVGLAAGYGTYPTKANDGHEIAASLRVLYHLPLGKDVSLYAGPGYGYHYMKAYNDVTSSKGHLAYFGGIRYWALDQYGLFLELNNNRYKSGLVYQLGLATRF